MMLTLVENTMLVIKEKSHQRTEEKLLVGQMKKSDKLKKRNGVKYEAPSRLPRCSL